MAESTAFSAVSRRTPCSRFAVTLSTLIGASRGTPAEYEDVIKLARLPRVYMKVSSLNAVPNVKPLVKRLYDTFGPDRLISGGYGMSMPAFEEATALIDRVFDFAPESDRAKIRGLTAMRVFGFQ
jgi:predicted TIM-barrel fold metal-dependent hydrolase